MGFKDSLNAAGPGRAPRCRICVLIDTLPDPDGRDLAIATGPNRTTGPVPIARALELEGYPDMAAAVKHHMYACQRAAE